MGWFSCLCLGALLLGTASTALSFDSVGKFVPLKSPQFNTGMTQEESIPAPVFSGTFSPIQEPLSRQMMGTSYHQDCPVPLADLSQLTLSHWGTDGQVHSGTLVVADDYAEELLNVFEALFNARFVIEKMQPVSFYDGSDSASMADNNTSAFNCRSTTGGTGWSEHSYGHAIDINPRWNPYVRGDTVLPPEGQPFTERNAALPGLIVEGDVVVRNFQQIGWTWGGNWRSLKDYQHFSANGR